jgi:hypothetical protein
MIRTITLTQDGRDSDRYEVTGLTNTLKPKIGTLLTATEAHRLIRPNTKVIVKGAK